MKSIESVRVNMGPHTSPSSDESEISCGKRAMIYGSICSGIEAASVAWHPLGWHPAFFAEIDKAASAVLAQRFPGVPNLGDFTKITPQQSGPIDILVGGTPCQDFSIAGLRAGLGGDRGNLTLEFVRLAERFRSAWLVWENVPGVLSSKKGRDFASILGGLSGLSITPPPTDGWKNSGVISGGPGYGLAWRVLDAQYVRTHGMERAVPQRRRRVFVVGYLGDWRRAAAVLLERESLCGNPPPRREAGKGVAHDVAPCIGASGPGFERTGDTRGQDCVIADVAPALDASYGRLQGASGQDLLHGHSHLLAFGGNNTAGPIEAATALRAKGGSGHGDFESETFVAHALRAEGFDASEDGTGRGTPLVPVAYRTSANCGAWETGDRTDALTTGTDPASTILAFSSKDHGADAGPTSPTLRAMGHSGSHANAGGQVAIAFDTTQITSPGNYSVPKAGDACHPLAATAHVPAIAIQERAICENPDAGPDGVGVRDDGASYTLEARTVPQAVAYGLTTEQTPKYNEGCALTLTKQSPTGGGQPQSVAYYAFPPRIARNGRGDMGDVVNALNAESGETGKGDAAPCVAVAFDMRNGTEDSVSQTLQAAGIGSERGGNPNAIPHTLTNWAVRRLTPTECERLQAFPDGHTLVPNGRGGMMADGPRYKMLGNSMAGNVMRWIGTRIQMVEDLDLDAA